MKALSDYVPALAGNQERSGWLPRTATLDPGAHWSMRHSHHGEGLLDEFNTPVLLHIGPNLGERAANFVYSREGGRALLYHPLEAVREEQRQLYANDASFSVLNSLDELRAHQEVLVYVDVWCFSLDLIAEIASKTKVRMLVGGFDGKRYIPVDVQLALREHVDRFWIYDQTRQIPLYSTDDLVDVSVIVPLYNIEAYIENCLRTLSDPDGLRIEVIVVNDGSSDQGPEIVQRFSAEFPHIKLINQQNAGCAAARQAGLSAANGRYVGFVDGDDWVNPKMFRKLFNAALTSNADVAMCGYTHEYMATGASEPVVEFYGSAKRKEFDLWSIDAGEVVLNPPSIWRKIFRRAFLERNAISFHTSIKRFDDILFNCEVMFSAPSVVHTSGDYYHYRLDRPGQTVGFRDKRLFIHFEIFQRLAERVERIGSESVEKLFRKVQIGTHFWVDGLLDEPLKAEYRALAAQEMFRGHLYLDDKSVQQLGYDLSPEKGEFVTQLRRYI